jgi:hypothetical protein
VAGRAKERLRQIVAIGGGGFSMEPRNLRLDRYVLALTGKPRPRVCFVPTASGDSRDYVRRFHLAMEKHRCVASELTLFRRDARDLRDFILSQDVIYVGGGNTANLLAVWRYVASRPHARAYGVRLVRGCVDERTLDTRSWTAQDARDRAIHPPANAAASANQANVHIRIRVISAPFPTELGPRQICAAPVSC